MTEDNLGASGPSSYDMDLYGHVCVFVSSTEERHKVVDPFVSEGHAQGDKITYVINPDERAEHVRHLRQLGYDMPRLLEQRQIELYTWPETYLRGGSFDQDKALEFFDEMLKDVPPPRIRLVADMGWAIKEEDFTRAMLEYESRGNQRQNDRRHFTICIYDTTKFGGDVLIDVLRTHPAALIGGILHVNPFFVPMTEFMEELQSREHRS